MELTGLLQRLRGQPAKPAPKMHKPSASVGGSGQRQTFWLRGISFGLGAVLALYATSRIVADVARPTFRTADFIANGPRPAIEDDGALAASVSFDGGVMSDRATSKARQALEATGLSEAARREANRDAQSATQSALAVSPINSAMWLVLGLLKASASEPPTGALKMSFLTGPLTPDAVASRIRAVATTAAAGDEEIQVLGLLDVRTLLTKYPASQPALAASYRQASPAGKKFILDATAVVDSKFSNTLRLSK